MPTDWPPYSLLPLAIAIGWILPLGIPWLWFRFALRKGKTTWASKPASLQQSQKNLDEPISVRFHRAALLFPVFLSLFLLVSPFLFSLHGAVSPRAGLILVVAAVLSIVLVFYCLGKGDLSWTTSRARNDEESERVDL